VVALRRTVGEKPRALRAVGGGGEQLGLGVGRRLVADIDAVDALRDVECQRLAERVTQRRIGAAARLVTGNVESGRPAQAVGEDRVEVGRRLLGRLGRDRYSRTARTTLPVAPRPSISFSASAAFSSPNDAPTTGWTTPDRIRRSISAPISTFASRLRIT
jgi:hypothetical protein